MFLFEEIPKIAQHTNLLDSGYIVDERNDFIDFYIGDFFGDFTLDITNQLKNVFFL